MLLAHYTVGLFPSFQEEMYECVIFSLSVYPRIFYFQLSKEMLVSFGISVLGNLRLPQPQSRASSQNCEKQLLNSSCLFVRLAVHPSVRPHGTTRLPLEGFHEIFDTWILLENLSRNARFIKIGQELQVLLLKTNMHFWSYLTQFFLKW